METPFPRTTLTPMGKQHLEQTPQNVLPFTSASAVHDLEELFLLAFPASFERRLHLVEPHQEATES